MVMSNVWVDKERVLGTEVYLYLANEVYLASKWRAYLLMMCSF